MYYTYILYSESLRKYYVGHTKDLEKRFIEHNRAKSKYTRIGVPWKLVKYFQIETKAEANRLEIKIKQRGCKRFLDNLQKQIKVL